jgi:hypothetical protein
MVNPENAPAVDQTAAFYPNQPYRQRSIFRRLVAQVRHPGKMPGS